MYKNKLKVFSFLTLSLLMVFVLTGCDSSGPDGSFFVGGEIDVPSEAPISPEEISVLVIDSADNIEDTVSVNDKGEFGLTLTSSKTIEPVAGLEDFYFDPTYKQVSSQQNISFKLVEDSVFSLSAESSYDEENDFEQIILSMDGAEDFSTLQELLDHEDYGLDLEESYIVWKDTLGDVLDVSLDATDQEETNSFIDFDTNEFNIDLSELADIALQESDLEVDLLKAEENIEIVLNVSDGEDIYNIGATANMSNKGIGYFVGHYYDQLAVFEFLLSDTEGANFIEMFNSTLSDQGELEQLSIVENFDAPVFSSNTDVISESGEVVGVGETELALRLLYIDDFEFDFSLSIEIE